MASGQSTRQAVIVGGHQIHVVRQGDTLTAIAARHGVTAPALAALNGLSLRDALRVDRTLRIENPHIAVIDTGRALTINIAQRMLFHFDGAKVFGYPVTVGRHDWPTPTGEFRIATKEKDPTWDVPASIQREMADQGKPVILRVAPSADNPLGARWLGLSLPGIGIHGTNAPSSIYRYASHGCIRMHPDHIAELFERVEVGMIGMLVYEPIILAAIDGRVWLEVHPDPYRRVADPAAHVRAAAAAQAITELIDWPAVRVALGRRDGAPEDISRDDPVSER